MESLPSSSIPPHKSINKTLVHNNLNLPMNITGNFSKKNLPAVRSAPAGVISSATAVDLHKNTSDITKKSSLTAKIPSCQDIKNPNILHESIQAEKKEARPFETEKIIFPEAFWEGGLDSVVSVLTPTVDLLEEGEISDVFPVRKNPGVDLKGVPHKDVIATSPVVAEMTVKVRIQAADVSTSAGLQAAIIVDNLLKYGVPGVHKPEVLSPPVRGDVALGNKKLDNAQDVYNTEVGSERTSVDVSRQKQPITLPGINLPVVSNSPTPVVSGFDVKQGAPKGFSFADAINGVQKVGTIGIVDFSQDILTAIFTKEECDENVVQAVKGEGLLVVQVEKQASDPAVQGVQAIQNDVQAVQNDVQIVQIVQDVPDAQFVQNQKADGSNLHNQQINNKRAPWGTASSFFRRRF